MKTKKESYLAKKTQYGTIKSSFAFLRIYFHSLSPFHANKLTICLILFSFLVYIQQFVELLITMYFE